MNIQQAIRHVSKIPVTQLNAIKLVLRVDTNEQVAEKLLQEYTILNQLYPTRIDNSAFDENDIRRRIQNLNERNNFLINIEYINEYYNVYKTLIYPLIHMSMNEEERFHNREFMLYSNALLRKYWNLVPEFYRECTVINQLLNNSVAYSRRYYPQYDPDGALATLLWALQITDLLLHPTDMVNRNIQEMIEFFRQWTHKGDREVQTHLQTTEEVDHELAENMGTSLYSLAEDNRDAQTAPLRKFTVFRGVVRGEPEIFNGNFLRDAAKGIVATSINEEVANSFNVGATLSIEVPTRCKRITLPESCEDITSLDDLLSHSGTERATAYFPYWTIYDQTTGPETRFATRNSDREIAVSEYKEEYEVIFPPGTIFVYKHVNAKFWSIELVAQIENWRHRAFRRFLFMDAQEHVPDWLRDYTLVDGDFPVFPRLPNNLKALKLIATKYPHLQNNSLPTGLVSLILGNDYNKEFDTGVLPNSLTSLILGNDYNQVFNAGVLPNSLTSLILGLEYNQKFNAGVLPNSLTSLTLGENYDHKFDEGDLPNSLTSLTLELKYNQKFNEGVLPGSLTSLTLGLEYNQEFNAGVLPDSLTSLTLGNDYNQEFNAGVLPNSLTSLTLGQNYNKVFNVRVIRSNLRSQVRIERDLPDSLTSLTLGKSYDPNLLFAAGVLPGSLTSLTLGREYNEQFAARVLPDSLTSLTLGRFYNKQFAARVLPDSLTSLTLGYKYNQTFDEGVLPTSLTSFTLGHDYNQKFDEGVLPDSLTSLTLGRFYNEQFAARVLPDSLTSLTLGYKYNQTFNAGVLPDSLTSLILGHDYNQKFDEGVLPDSLTSLTLGRFYNEQFDEGVLPNSLTSLTLGDYYNRKFNDRVLPNTLTSLTLGHDYSQDLDERMEGREWDKVHFMTVNDDYSALDIDIVLGVGKYRLVPGSIRRLVFTVITYANFLPRQIDYNPNVTEVEIRTEDNEYQKGKKRPNVSINSPDCFPTSVQRLIIPESLNIDLSHLREGIEVVRVSIF